MGKKLLSYGTLIFVWINLEMVVKPSLFEPCVSSSLLFFVERIWKSKTHVLVTRVNYFIKKTVLFKGHAKGKYLRFLFVSASCPLDFVLLNA